ncbi:MAG TPA: hypothetical protein VHO23_02850, partial [Candidatus Paceibacterota bacterium]|nr:hypothetical protein [Candidatus Paceibacterota bacterium]
AAFAAFWAMHASAAEAPIPNEPAATAVACALFDEENVPLGRVDRDPQEGYRPDKLTGIIRFGIAYRTAPVYEICRFEFADGSTRTYKHLAPGPEKRPERRT